MFINFYMYMYLKKQNIYLIIILRPCYLKSWGIIVNGNVLREISKPKNKYKTKHADRNVHKNHSYYTPWLSRKSGD